MGYSQMEFRGYHGTCSKHKKSISKDGLDPDKVKVRLDHWLGQGVYFFEEYKQAMWWANDNAQKPYNKGSYALIYVSEIEVDRDEVLNLDNNDELDIFMTYILKDVSEIERDAKGRYPAFTPENFRAIYFDYYKKRNNISVIVHTFQKNSAKYVSIRNGEELQKQRQLIQMLGIYYGEKQICVSKKECIKNQCLIYNEEEEEEVI